MLAVQYARFGVPAEVAQLVETQGPSAPEAGEALIEVERVAINPSESASGPDCCRHPWSGSRHHLWPD